LSVCALVLFDIDGTLVRRAGPHHKQALTDAVKLVTGRSSTLDDVPTHGMLDGELLRVMLGRLSFTEPEIARMLPVLMQTAQSCYQQNCPSDLSDKICPGVRAFLEQLNESGIPAGLVTGNLTSIGWKKMELAGLRSYFRLGAFADRGRTRAELVAAAIRQATAETLIDSATRVSLIGDHPNDVRAARANGIRSIATATGLCSYEELRAEAPDVLVRDLTELSVQMVLS
jgi:phosphoglycolate phosphatase-like HAD superfamily hydrolase